MPVQYQPLPGLELGNMNLMGAYAQGQAARMQELQQEKLAQQMAIQAEAAKYAANKDIREAAKLQSEQSVKDFELASKKYDSLINMAPRLNAGNYGAWYKQVTETFPLAAATLPKQYDPEAVKMVAMQGADLKPQVLQQHFGDTTRFVRVGATGAAEVVPGSEVTAPAEQAVVDLGDKGKFLQNKRTGALTPITEEMLATGAAPAGLNMPAAKAAIANIESGGNYKALGPVTDKGDRAYGKYQVMGANIPSWTKQALGQPMTPAEFLASPEAQEKVFEDQFARNTVKYGSAQDAASVWFSGKPLAKAGQRADILGTTVPSYVNKFNAVYGRQPAVQNAMVAPITGENPVLSPMPLAPPAGLIAPQPQAPIMQPAALPPVPPMTVAAPAAVGSEAAKNKTFAESVLGDAGFDPRTGTDKITDLIKESTAGGLQRAAAGAVEWATGRSTPGQAAISKLEVFANDKVLSKLGGKLGAQVSDQDREFIKKTMGDIANPELGVDRRLAAWESVKQVMAKYAGLPAAAPAAAPTTGRVIDFSQLPKRR
jgi:hypothetical protein